MTLDLNEKIAIVTGTATLIGDRVVAELVQAGASVFAADIDREEGQRRADAYDDRVVFSATDVSLDAQRASRSAWTVSQPDLKTWLVRAGWASTLSDTAVRCVDHRQDPRDGLAVSCAELDGSRHNRWMSSPVRAVSSISCSYSRGRLVSREVE